MKSFHPGRWFVGGLATGVLAMALLFGAGWLVASSLGHEQLRQIPLYGLLSGQTFLSEEQQERLDRALEDAEKVAEEMASLSERASAACADPSADGYFDELTGVRDEQRAVIAANIERIRDDRRAVSEAIEVLGEGEQVDRLARSDKGMEVVADALAYEQAMLDAQQDLGAIPAGESVDGQSSAYYEPAWAATQALAKVSAPACVSDLHDRYVSLWEPLSTYLYDIYENGDSSTLELHSMREVLDWSADREARALFALHSGLSQQYRYASWMMGSSAEEGGLPHVEYRAVDQISPNLYSTMDSVLDLAIGTAERATVTIEAEVTGLTQKIEARRTVEPGANHILIKPQLLTDLSAADLESGRTAQIDFKVTAEDGTVLEQQSVSVEILGLYDFNWIDSSRGTTSQLDLIAWLRPSQARIDEINRRAAEYMGQWTDGLFAEIAGYQYGDDWYATLLQVAAVQMAFSETGTKYVVDTYSSRADQRVLTPAAAIERQQALCVETSLIVASCLTSAGMHPYIVVTPTHSQVAVESWDGSGCYYLIETSVLPYGGVDRTLSYESVDFYGGLVPYCEDEGGTYDCLWYQGSSEFWDRFIASMESEITDSDAYGGVYVIDCDIQRIFGIYGLESM